MRRLAPLLLLLAGCERAMQDMYDQPKYKPMAASELFEEGGSARPPPPGTVVARAGPFADSSGGRAAQAPLSGAAPPVMPLLALPQQGPEPPLPDDLPVDVDAALLGRGRERFGIYCAPCHSLLGDGDGYVARRGFPAPPSFHTRRLRQAPAQHFFNVITHGYGAMYAYADRVAPADRWAIAAWIRVLQFSQHAPLQALPAADRQRLRESGR